ncbi:uncharacterized protein LOC116347240 [Contarinia nasturtii]|uniref:uncharacterized protein LOC116347240 n=1 Tax=Contarinia nasturtii TaxID=265458 RepID=UPI0012D40202|nr:uncharacterized protein LOC116347240 [Contarinia nasturtii]
MFDRNMFAIFFIGFVALVSIGNIDGAPSGSGSTALSGDSPTKTTAVAEKALPSELKNGRKPSSVVKLNKSTFPTLKSKSGGKNSVIISTKKGSKKDVNTKVPPQMDELDQILSLGYEIPPAA